jgi:restriction system protein
MLPLLRYLGDGQEHALRACIEHLANEMGVTEEGRPEIQKFVGALQGQRARKGIFITTSTFSKDALDYAERIDSKVVLIDGTMLARLMIQHNLGVSTIASYELKKTDTDYFTEE